MPSPLNEKFQFAEWPFAIVPTEKRGQELWADRNGTRNQIDAAVQAWTASDGSTINLLWADLGSGKTHTLYHIERQCRDLGMLPIYVLLPQSITKFNTLYRAIADKLDWNLVASSLPASARGRFATPLRRALGWLTSDVDIRRQGLASRWIVGDQLSQSQCEAIGVSAPIRTGDECVEVLRLAISALAESTNRIVLMIDEYQRIAEGTRRQLQEIGHGIHTLYNGSPAKLTLLLSCAMGRSDDYTLVLTPEVQNRLSAQRIDLPYLNTSDIKTYICDLFRHYRIPQSEVNDEFPLSIETLSQISELVREEFEDEVTPRKLNEALAVLMHWAARKVLPIPISTGGVNRWIEEEGREVLRQLRT